MVPRGPNSCSLFAILWILEANLELQLVLQTREYSLIGYHFDEKGNLIYNQFFFMVLYGMVFSLSTTKLKAVGH